jgi:tetratricopeptide (TPR) repeat protein
MSRSVRGILPRHRRLVILIGAGLALLYGAASVRRLPATDRMYVLDSAILPLAPRVVSPGWRVVPLALARVSAYPSAPRTLRADLSGARAAVSREGARIEIEAELTYDIPADRVLDLHRARGPRYEADWLTDLLRRTVAETLAAVDYDLVRNRDPDLLRALREALGREVNPAGLRIGALRIAPVAAPGEGAAGILKASQPPLQRRMIVLGVDSFDWRLIDPLVKRGRMPNLARLVARGTRANLKTIRPILSPVIWTSIATGVKPSRHGIVDFVVNDPVTGEMVPVTSRMRQVPALWSLVSRQGLDVGVVAWWATWPAETVQGQIVTDRVAFQLFNKQMNEDWKNADPAKTRGKTYPPELFEKIRPLIKAPTEVTDAELAPFLGGGRFPRSLTDEERGMIDDFRTVLAAGETYHRIALGMLRDDRPALAMFYYEGPDEASHLFMRYRSPLLPGVERRQMNLFGSIVDRYYERQDRYLGEIVEAAGPDTTVILVSDHGFKSDTNRPYDTDPRIDKGNAADWHSPIGVFVAAGPDIRPGFTLGSASILDVAPTVLALFGLPAARDMDGQPLTDMMSAGFTQAHPVAWVDSYGGARRAGEEEIAQASAGDAELLEKLRNLGYIGEERVTAKNNRGVIALEEGDIDGAIATFEQALQTGEAGTMARLNLARAWLTKGDIDKAASYAGEALRDEPNNKQALLLLGGVAVKRESWDEAERLCRRALAIDPAFTPAHSKLGELLRKRGRDDESLAEFRKVIDIAPLSPVEYNNIGNIHREHGRIDKAMESYREALRCDAQYIGAYNNLGLCLQEKGKLDEAKALYDKALAIRPENPILRNSMGTLKALKGDRDGAIAEFRHAVKADPKWPIAQGNLATLLFEAGKSAEAEPEFARWVQIEPGSIEAGLGYGLVLLTNKNTDAAIARFQDLLKRDPDNFRAHVALGETLLRRGDLAQAQVHLETAVRIDGRIARVYNSLAEVYLKRGLRNEAGEALRRSLAIDPNQQAVRRSLAGIGR